jgi:hypothetical protein
MDTWISHLKIQHIIIAYASICQAAIKPPAESTIDMSCYCRQTAAPSIHGLAQLRQLEIGPHTDPVVSQRSNLQEWWKTWFVKDKVIANMPYCREYSTNSHSDVCLFRFYNTLSQFPNKCAIFEGEIMLKDMWIICQMILAKVQWIKMCCTVSSWSYKQHFFHPCKFLFIRLSLVIISFR